MREKSNNFSTREQILQIKRITKTDNNNDLALAALDSMGWRDPVAVDIQEEFDRVCQEHNTDPGLKHPVVVLCGTSKPNAPSALPAHTPTCKIAHFPCF